MAAECRERKKEEKQNTQERNRFGRVLRTKCRVTTIFLFFFFSCARKIEPIIVCLKMVFRVPSKVAIESRPWWFSCSDFWMAAKRNANKASNKHGWWRCWNSKNSQRHTVRQMQMQRRYDQRIRIEHCLIRNCSVANKQPHSAPAFVRLTQHTHNSIWIRFRAPIYTHRIARRRAVYGWTMFVLIQTQGRARNAFANVVWIGRTSSESGERLLAILRFSIHKKL